MAESGGGGVGAALPAVDVFDSFATGFSELKNSTETKEGLEIAGQTSQASHEVLVLLLLSELGMRLLQAD